MVSGISRAYCHVVLCVSSHQHVCYFARIEQGTSLGLVIALRFEFCFIRTESVQLQALSLRRYL